MHRSIAVLCTIIAATGVSALTGCRGETTDNPPRQFLPDLDDQLKYKAQGESSFFADGRTMREPPANTVAFGRSVHTENVTGFTRTGRAVSADFSDRADMLKEEIGRASCRERV